MSGKRVKKAPKGQMARRIVVHCLVVLTAASLWALTLETVAAVHEVDIDLTDSLTFIGGVFGGELLMTLIKRLFAKSSDTDKEDAE